MIAKVSWSRRLLGAVAPSRACFFGLALVTLAVEYISFDSFSVPSLDRIHQVSAAVVFTGQFEHVDVGLRLPDSGAVPRLYISGLNAKQKVSETILEICTITRGFASVVSAHRPADNSVFLLALRSYLRHTRGTFG
jgi:hypothetical protein